MSKKPKGCAPLWNDSCSARECLYPHCRLKDFDRKTAREQIAVERREVLNAWRRAMPHHLIQKERSQ